MKREKVEPGEGDMQMGDGYAQASKRSNIVAEIIAQTDHEMDKEFTDYVELLEDDAPLNNEEKAMSVEVEFQKLKQHGTFAQIGWDEVDKTQKVIDITVVYKRRGGEPRARICAQDFRGAGAQDPELYASTLSCLALILLLLHASKKALAYGEEFAQP